MGFIIGNKLIFALAIGLMSLQTATAIAEDGPSLNETLAFIQSKLLTVGEVSFSAPGAPGVTYSEKQAKYDKISYEGCVLHETDTDKVESKIDFSKITDISLTSATETLSRNVAGQGTKAYRGRHAICVCLSD